MGNSSLDPKNAALGDSESPIIPDTLRVRYRAFSERWRYFMACLTGLAIALAINQIFNLIAGEHFMNI